MTLQNLLYADELKETLVILVTLNYDNLRSWNLHDYNNTWTFTIINFEGEHLTSDVENYNSIL
jgi:uncharacterized membrane protein YheB (UPF0754 family)